MSTPQLMIHEQLLLICLSDRDGATSLGAKDHAAIAGGIIAELAIHGKISVPEPSMLSTVHAITDHPTGHPLLDACFERIARRPYPAKMQTLIAELAKPKDLRERTADSLIDLGILRADKASVAGVFSRKAYPQVNPAPKREMIATMRQAIFSDSKSVDERTAVLITLANAAGLLTLCFDKGDLNARHERLAMIANGDAYAQATAETIEATSSAVVIGVMVGSL